MTTPIGVKTCLWFKGDGEEAARFYLATLPDARLGHIARWGPGGALPEGTALTIELSIAGHDLLILNAGPAFQLNEAVSISVTCEKQSEVDRLWSVLSEGGATSRCGWLKDRYGLSWQIVPAVLPRLMKSAERERVGRMVAAMMQMTKLDGPRLVAAFDGA